MPDDVHDRIAPAQRRSELREMQVLPIGVGLVVAALELDSHGKIVAALAPLPARRAGVPGALGAGNELDQLAIAPDQEMRRHVEVAQGPVVRVGGGIEGVGEQPDDGITAELARRQADVVHDQQRDRRVLRTLVEIGRGHLNRPGEHTVRVKKPETHSPNPQPFHAVA